ncbi:MAG: hypothetical protein JXA04_05065 [Gammaproteobacteria bacterium]|nr:hypothetical protein [Gammaproteobacteria bacterium]
MSYSLASKKLEYLKSLLGKEIIVVRRQLLASDLEVLDSSSCEQEADGPIELKFNDSNIASFVADTESMSIVLAEYKMQKWGDSYTTVDVSKNSFWSARLNKKIERIEILISNYTSEKYPSEFGLVFTLFGGVQFVIEYLSDSEHTDVIRLTNNYEGPDCNHIELKN